MQDDPLDATLQAAFDALPHEMAPPPDLESRVVSQLRSTGRLAQPRRGFRAWATAASLLLFAGGFVLGRGGWPLADAPPKPQYLLLLYGAEPTSRAAEAAREAEYSAWARAEAAAGRIVGGEELDGSGIVMGGSPPIGRPTGYFLVAAASRVEAQATAARCPHLRHGGTVVLASIVTRDSSGGDLRPQ